MTNRFDFEEEAVYALVEADYANKRLDVFATQLLQEQYAPEFTRSQVQRLISSKRVLVNGAPKSANYKLRAGETVEVFPPEPVETEIVAQDIPLNIVYQDEYIAVINKEKGMVVHPSPGHDSGTLVNAAMFHIKDLSGIGGEIRPGIVHRIDKMTSGLLVIAKNDLAHLSLSEQIKQREMHRIYLALVSGNIKEDSGTINAPIGRHPKDRKRMAVLDSSQGSAREAVTHYTVLHRFGETTLIEARLETGRTHQIRVHLAHIKHPCLGDDVYSSGNNNLGLEGQALHAIRLELLHPKTHEQMCFFAQLPEYFTKALLKLGADSKLLDEINAKYCVK